ncbi:MAG TPA: M12 family metallopeptidase [Thermoanaerobaculia bacterium]|nr:M12 family metallopeptidase [Thermoanaerobaculia bacterium]
MPNYSEEESARSGGTAVAESPTSNFSYCALPTPRVRVLPEGLEPNNARLIRQNDQKWASGTVLHYYFFDQKSDGRNVRFTDGTTQWLPWTTTNAQKDVVRQAFDAWRRVGIGITFTEVRQRGEAEIRIGFEDGDGAWSYVGRDVLGIGQNERTMNFGWSLTRSTREIDTAIHEIGHTLGFPHEHQNPNSGIEWDEEAVYRNLAGDPNFWSRDTTFQNIIRKIEADAVQGSKWDPDSIMEYPFDPGLIRKPAQYFTTGLRPAGGLSQRDKTWVKSFYPPLQTSEHRPMSPFRSEQLDLVSGEQRNFSIRPEETREYVFQTFGNSDLVMVLFENVNDEWRFVAGDDDSAQPRNSSIRAKLFRGREYALRIRLYAQQSGQTAVMMW